MKPLSNKGSNKPDFIQELNFIQINFNAHVTQSNQMYEKSEQK